MTNSQQSAISLGSPSTLSGHWCNFLIWLLTCYFSELEEQREELGIQDLQVSLTTLEDVFLRITQRLDDESDDEEVWAF